jgi:hypothetical protein
MIPREGGAALELLRETDEQRLHIVLRRDDARPPDEVTPGRPNALVWKSGHLNPF